MSSIRIKKGVYLVVDPSQERRELLTKIKLVVEKKLVAIQIWDNFDAVNDVESLIEQIIRLCRPYKIPVLINNCWQYLINTELDGVHFDILPTDYETICTTLNRKFIAGVTCQNNLEVVKSAEELKLDYISFCSIFPSKTANSCELVHFDTIEKARRLSTLPIFLAGGIRPENMHLLNKLDYDGIAVVSGVMRAEHPDIEIDKYEKELNNLK